MKYVKDSALIPGAKDFYSIISYMIDKVKKSIHITLMYVEHTSDGLIKIEYSEHTIIDKIEYIIDPDWNESSNPPKPADFDKLNPLTWGSLTFDQIPRVLNKDFMYATNLINTMESGSGVVESVLIDGLISLKILSSDSTVWTKV